MEIVMPFFPKKWVKLLEEAIVKTNFKSRIVSLTKIEGNENYRLIIDTPDFFEILMLGNWMGAIEIMEAYKDTLPKIADNVSKIVDKHTNTSEN